MLYIIRDIIFILLSIIGIADITHRLILWFLKSDGDENIWLIMPITKDTENAEQLIRSTIARAEYCGKGKWKKILCCISNDVTEENIEICKKLALDFPILEINFGKLNCTDTHTVVKL